MLVARLILLLLSPPSPSSSPDLICQLLMAMVLAGPHLPALDRSGLAGPPLPALDRRESERCGAVGLAGPQRRCGPRQRGSERCGARRTSTGEIRSTVGLRTSTGEIRIAVGLAGPQPARFCAPWASPDLNRTSTATNKAI